MMPHFFFTIGSALMLSPQPETDVVSPVSTEVVSLASTQIVSQDSSTQTLHTESLEAFESTPTQSYIIPETERMISDFFDANSVLIKRLSKIFLYANNEFYYFYQGEIQSILFTLYHADNLFSQFFRVDPQGAEHVINEFIQELSKRHVTYQLQSQKFIDCNDLLSHAKRIQRIIQMGWYQNLDF
ncbi:MAG: hypothetical protein CNLJKLNK_01000 [Holosporales bacterium]